MDTLTISRENLLASAAYVPPADRLRFVATLVLGEEGLARLEVSEDDRPRSYPMTAEQLRALKGRLDAGTWLVIITAVRQAQDGVGTVDWATVKKITGVGNWAAFAQGRLAGLNRSLRKIVSDRRAMLLWEGEGWVEDGKGDYSAGTLGIDGPVVQLILEMVGPGSN